MTWSNGRQVPWPLQRASAQEPLALRSLSRSDARSAAGLRTNNAASSLRRPLSRLAKRLEGMPKNHQRKRFACEAESCNAAGPGADDRRPQQFVTLTPDAPGALPRQRLRVEKVMGAGQGRRSVVPGCVSIAPGVSPLHRVCAYVYFWAFQVQWGSVREWAESTAEARSIATCSVFSPATWMLVAPPQPLRAGCIWPDCQALGTFEHIAWQCPFRPCRAPKPRSRILARFGWSTARDNSSSVSRLGRVGLRSLCGACYGRSGNLACVVFPCFA